MDWLNGEEELIVGADWRVIFILKWIFRTLHFIAFDIFNKKNLEILQPKIEHSKVVDIDDPMTFQLVLLSIFDQYLKGIKLMHVHNMYF